MYLPVPLYLATQRNVYKDRDLENKILELFADILGLDFRTINDAVTPDEINAWDSMNHINLISVFEDELSIDIEPEEIPEMMESFGKFKSVILTKIS